jgi:hypothetical protein
VGQQDLKVAQRSAPKITYKLLLLKGCDSELVCTAVPFTVGRHLVKDSPSCLCFAQITRSIMWVENNGLDDIVDCVVESTAHDGYATTDVKSPGRGCIRRKA